MWIEIFVQLLVASTLVAALPTQGFCAIHGKAKPPVRYNVAEWICENNTLVPLHTSTTPSTTTSISTTTTQKRGQSKLIIVEPNPCHLTSEQRKSGYECCGEGRYHPDFQTCCMQMVYKYTVHDNMDSKLHSCCGLEAYPRNAMPCRNSARNDKLFTARPLPKIKGIDTKNEMCHPYEYTFIVTLMQRKPEEKRYIARIEALSVKRLYLAETTEVSEKEIKVPYDDHSTKGKTRKISYLVRSNTDHMSNAFLYLFVENDDMILKLRKKKRSKKQIKRYLKKLNRKCKRGTRHGRNRKPSS